MMPSQLYIGILVILLCLHGDHSFVSRCARSISTTSRQVYMKVDNDAFTRANRVARTASAGDRKVELFLPLGLELDQDKEGNVFIKSIDPGSRAEKTGKIFVGDRIAMVYISCYVLFSCNNYHYFRHLRRLAMTCGTAEESASVECSLPFE